MLWLALGQRLEAKGDARDRRSGGSAFGITVGLHLLRFNVLGDRAKARAAEWRRKVAGSTLVYRQGRLV